MKIINFILLLALISSLGFIQTSFAEPFKLEAQISKNQDLPPEMYGEWEVLGSLIDSTHPFMFNAQSQDFWQFQKNGEYVTLTNPNTGATSTITINSVENLTATFTRRKADGNDVETEQCVIKLEGDFFSGTDLLVIEDKSNGGLFVAKYKIIGKKLSGKGTNEIFYHTKK